jgi:lipoprotein-anchoring transpeptidase ErfK/SrfK
VRYVTVAISVVMLVMSHARAGFAENLALQIALEREGFSPGMIDGKPGAKTAIAIADFQRVHELPVTGKLDDDTSAALKLFETPGTQSYNVAQEDAEHVSGPMPRSWNEKAAMKELGYLDIADAVAERFHTKAETLSLLNPDVAMTTLNVGQELTVPAAAAPPLPGVTRLEINLGEKTIRGFNKSDREVVLVHCSIARDKAKRPAGEAHVKVVAMNPDYTFDPAVWPEVHDVEHRLRIPPGPRNPVGMAWIGLDLPGYGIHGTPRPWDIGKTGSHGCFRLANWDAVRLASAIKGSIPVTFVGE